MWAPFFAVLLLYRLLRSIFASGLIAIIQSSNIVNISESPLGGVLVWAQNAAANSAAHIFRWLPQFIHAYSKAFPKSIWWKIWHYFVISGTSSMRSSKSAAHCLRRFYEAARPQDVFFRDWGYLSIQFYFREMMQAAHTSPLTSSTQLFSAHPTIVTSVCASEWSAYSVLRTLRVVLHNKNALYERDLYT